jgi:hypothetical protein
MKDTQSSNDYAQVRIILLRDLDFTSSSPTVYPELWGMAAEFWKLRGDYSFLF